MSVVEVIVSIAIFSIISVSAFDMYMRANRLVVFSDHESQAYALAEEGIEATRSIRDQSFSTLTAGTKGIALVSNVWQFSGTSDTSNGYLRKIVITSIDANTVSASSSVDWLERGATSTVSLSTILTNWHKTVGMSDGLTVNTTGANLSLLDLDRLLTGINLVSDGSYGTTTITKIKATWSGVLTSRRLQLVQSPNGTTLFSGSVASGSTVTLSSPITLVGPVTQSIQFRFDSTMVGGTFTFVFTLGDNSTVSTTITNPPIGV